jgi:hypothetical protein
MNFGKGHIYIYLQQLLSNTGKLIAKVIFSKAYVQRDKQ